MAKIYCIIPAFNEAETIGRIIAELKTKNYEIVVVDDGSSDNTAALARQKRAMVLRHIINRGQGAALQTGNDFALSRGADVIVHFDADGQFLADEVDRLVRPIIDGQADIVFGSRFLGIKSNMPFFKRFIIMPIARVINYLFVRAKLTDPQSGFRALSRTAAEKIKINQDGMAHCSEIISWAFKSKLIIKEVPVTVIYKQFGQSFGGGWKIIKDLLIGKLIN